MRLRIRTASGSLLALLLHASDLLAEEQAIEARKRDLAEIERSVQDLEQDLDTRRTGREALLAELEQRERDVAGLARSGHQLSAMIGEQEKALEGLQAKLEAQRDELQRQRVALRSLLRSAYVMGRGDLIRMLLDQEDVAQLSRIMAYYGYLNRTRVARIEAVAGRARDIERLVQETQQETRRLSDLAERQDDTRRRLAAAREERAQLLAELVRTIATGEERVAGLRAEARGLRQLLEQLERQARALPEAELRQEGISQRRGRLIWPLEGGRLVTRFGRPKGEGGQRWDGVVISAPEGAEVRAVHDGRVAYADWLRGFGLLLIIDHDDGYMTLYGHNETLLKEPGEWVGTGELIALSGNSGGRQSPGLYFAIRHRGRPLNPESWCRGKVVGWRGPGPGAQAEAAERLGNSPIQPGVSAPVQTLGSVARGDHANIRSIF